MSNTISDKNSVPLAPGVNINLPPGWTVSKVKNLSKKDSNPNAIEEDNENVDFAPPEIPSSITQQAAGKDGFSWTNPNTGRTYVKYGRVWKRTDGNSDDDPDPSEATGAKLGRPPGEGAPERKGEREETVEQPQSTLGDDLEKNLDIKKDVLDREGESDEEDLEFDSIKELLARFEENPEEVLKLLEKEAMRIDGESAQLPFGRDNSFYTPEAQSELQGELKQKLFNIARGENLTEEEEAEFADMINQTTVFNVGRHEETKLNNLRREMMEKYGINQSDVDVAISWGYHSYMDITDAIKETGPIDEYEPEGAQMAQQLQQMLQKMPGYSYEDLMREVQSEDELLPQGMLQRGEKRSNLQAREETLRFYEQAIGKDYVLSPHIMATTGFRELDDFLLEPNVKYIIQSKTDESGRGVAMDQFKFGLKEGEILFPAYSPFKVEKVDRVRDFSDRNAPYMDVTNDMWSNYTIDEIPDPNIRKAIQSNGKLSYNQIVGLQKLAQSSIHYHDTRKFMGEEQANKVWANSGQKTPLSSSHADMIMKRFSGPNIEPYAEIYLREV